VLLRPTALPTGQNDPLFERPDLTQDDYYRLQHPSRLTAARRVTARLSAASVAGLSQGAPNRAICMLPTVRWARPQRRVIGREDVDKRFRPGFPGFEVVRA
jgi:hypothetical protein